MKNNQVLDSSLRLLIFLCSKVLSILLNQKSWCLNKSIKIPEVGHATLALKEGIGFTVHGLQVQIPVEMTFCASNHRENP